MRPVYDVAQETATLWRCCNSGMPNPSAAAGRTPEAIILADRAALVGEILTELYQGGHHEAIIIVRQRFGDGS